MARNEKTTVEAITKPGVTGFHHMTQSLSGPCIHFQWPEVALMPGSATLCLSCQDGGCVDIETVSAVSPMAQSIFTL